MKVAFIAASVLAAVSSVSAHTYLDHVVLPGGATTDCIRHTSTWTTGQRNFPIKDLASKDMICGFAPTQPAAATCPITAGSKMSLFFGHDRAGDDIIASSHKGACEVYLAAAPADGSMPTGDAWFKIFEHGFDKATNKFCTEVLMGNGGQLDITIPAQVPSGKYLLRTEINALHEADTLYTNNPGRGIQLYVYCAEMQITGTGNADFEPKTLIPGNVNFQSPGVLFNLYAPYDSYPTFGPAVATAGGAAPAPVPVPAPSSSPAAPAPVSTPAAPVPTYTAPTDPEYSTEAPVPTYTAPTDPEYSTEAPAPTAAPTSAPAPPKCRKRN
ncbi:glycosyl hydrolase family 61-domain-containing protein [Fimicolochytrium jonesii]|uniref:glycosyl hydrolase family 61-domain-containing protein n=1 Tax=Fimicolochytrium jonesii TaxID=1396493 RepID=UPI0022FEB794|nr:glycosyl hydrolase family 61-domain-containing protein [Fimicolochytrium jonesii]KAI8824409.1 glycosyl hydrolase family 61-domain-containing protein [Fimicolochytrium jonesii]